MDHTEGLQPVKKRLRRSMTPKSPSIDSDLSKVPSTAIALEAKISEPTEPDIEIGESNTSTNNSEDSPERRDDADSSANTNKANFESSDQQGESPDLGPVLESTSESHEKDEVTNIDDPTPSDPTKAITTAREAVSDGDCANDGQAEPNNAGESPTSQMPAPSTESNKQPPPVNSKEGPSKESHEVDPVNNESETESDLFAAIPNGADVNLTSVPLFQEGSFFDQSMLDSFSDFPSSSSRRLRRTFGTSSTHTPLEFIPVEELPVIRESSPKSKKRGPINSEPLRRSSRRLSGAGPTRTYDSEGYESSADNVPADAGEDLDDTSFDMAEEGLDLKPPARSSRSVLKAKLRPDMHPSSKLPTRSQTIRQAKNAATPASNSEKPPAAGNLKKPPRSTSSNKKLPTATARKPAAKILKGGKKTVAKVPPKKAEEGGSDSAPSKNRNHKKRVLRRLLTTEEEQSLINRLDEEYAELLVCDEPLEVDKKNGITGMMVHVNRNWEANFRKLIVFTKIYGHALVPKEFRDTPGLASYCVKNRKWKKMYDRGEETQLTESRLRRLEALGFVWDAKKDKRFWNVQNECEDAWEKFENKVEELKAYRAEFGDCLVPKSYPQNPSLASFVSKQRAQYRKKHNNEFHSLTDEKEKILADIGFIFDTKNKVIRRRNLYKRYAGRWDAMFERLCEFQEVEGHTFVPRWYSKDQSLSSWVQRQRAHYKLKLAGETSSLSAYRFEKLRSIKFQYVKGEVPDDAPLPDDFFEEPFDLDESKLREKRLEQGIIYRGETAEDEQEDTPVKSEGDDEEAAGSGLADLLPAIDFSQNVYGDAGISDAETESEPEM